MTSQAQLEANRANAQKSTGPRSVEGKAISARNALKTGIDSEALIAPGEDPAALELLKAEYYAEHRPVTPEARLLVDTLIKNEWLLRRFDRIEGQLWTDVARHLEEPKHKPFRAARSYASIDKQLARLQTRMNAAQRNFQRALKDLLALEKTLEAEQNTQEAAIEPTENDSPERTQFGTHPAAAQPSQSGRIEPKSALETANPDENVLDFSFCSPNNK